MRIVHIITRLILGGAQENTLITCRLLAERGHEVTLITGPALGPEGQLFDQTKGQKYRTIVVDEMRRAVLPFKDYASYGKTKELLRELKPDIVHTHSAKAGIVGRFAAWSLKGEWDFRVEGVPPSNRGQDARDMQGPGSPNAISSRLGTHDALATRRPGVVHTLHGLSFHPYQSSWSNRLYIAFEKAAARRTDYFISVADAMTQQNKAAGIGVDKPYITAYSAIEEEQFLTPIPDSKLREFRRKHEIPREAVVLVTIARLFMLKGHDYIIESARELSKRFPNVMWLFVGDGNLADTYKEQIRRLGLTERFCFTGLIPPDQVPLAIQASDILVHPSLREGLARTLPQAMLCARPVISFDVDGAREVVNETTGRLIEPKNVPQLIEACAELIADKSLREKLGRTGREAVRTKFAPDTMVDTIEDVYRKLLA
ncbi:MAG: glycosyltransferase family 4 protein [Planctomycetes bacterium]|nr:glycosyltransferase family 4 protein [Planctomycetota bacterium]